MRLLPVSAFNEVFRPLAGKRIGYVRTPGNVGDLLIERAAFQLLSEFHVEFSVLCTNEVQDFDELVVAGGGNMGDLYPANRRIREKILRYGKPVTILPQSFTSPEPLPYDRVFVRERGSFQFAPTATLAPDLALGLEYTPTSVKPVRENGLCLRRDCESVVKSAASSTDPTHSCKTAIEYLELAASYRHIITDRLHFAIAGLICGRRVTFLPNSYHKNRSMYETWLQNIGCEWSWNVPNSCSRSYDSTDWVI